MNKVVVITGGCGELGLAAVERFLQEGAYVVCGDLKKPENCAILDDSHWRDRLVYVPVDVTSETSVNELVRVTLAKFGSIDILLANAGIEGPMGPMVKIPVADLKQVLAVNVVGVWNCLSAVISVMTSAGRGSIVITSSVAGLRGAAGMVPYNTSKHAVLGMMKSAALECSRHNIRVNAVAPGPIESRMMSAIGEGLAPGRSDFYRSRVADQTPMRRYGKAAEVAEAMLYLASDDSSFCTGHVLTVDGGALI